MSKKELIAAEFGSIGIEMAEEILDNLNYIHWASCPGDSTRPRLSCRICEMLFDIPHNNCPCGWYDSYRSERDLVEIVRERQAEFGIEIYEGGGCNGE